MRFVLSGVETNNKGAELMLYAILQEIERRFPRATVYFDIDSVQQGLSYIQTTLRLKEKPVEVAWRWYRKLHLPGIIKRLHIKVSTSWYQDCYAVPFAKYFIDGSGFHFSDEWDLPDWYINRKIQLWKSHRQRGAKLIFLPQAFGPFEKKESRYYLAEMARYAHVIMPREKVSYDYIQKSGVVDMNKVRIYTDFTSLVEGVLPKQYAHLKGGVCVIPNLRMIDHGAISFDNYIKLLSSIIIKVKSTGNKVYLLNHEGKGDEELAYSCQSAIGDDIEVVSGLNALEVKGLISTAYLVITSRFHGLASALNTCVPCLATSWSHKYHELFKDYKLQDCILPLDNLNAAVDMIGEYLDTEFNKSMRNHLLEQQPRIQQSTRDMWDYVWSV